MKSLITLVVTLAAVSVFANPTPAAAPAVDCSKLTEAKAKTECEVKAKATTATAPAATKKN